MPISRRSAFMLILACAVCAVSPAARAQAVKAAGSPGQPHCQTDADCVLDPIDCSECGHCPGEMPLAVLRAQIPALQEECSRHPPVRLNPKASKLNLTAPACSPCADPGEVQILWRAVCRQGACAVEQAGTQKRPHPRPTDLVNPPPSPQPKAAGTEKRHPSGAGPAALAGALTLSEAALVANDRSIRMVAWYWEPPQPCPPCPPQAECEACLPPYAQFGDRPNNQVISAEGRSFWVDEGHHGLGFLKFPVGQKFVLQGRWFSRSDPFVDRVFVLEDATPVP